LGEAGNAIHLELAPPHGSPSPAHASIAINSLGLIDNLQIAATGLSPGKAYQLILLGDGPEQVLLQFNANTGGSAIAQTLGPLKRLDHSNTKAPKLVFEVRSVAESGETILSQVP
jgi:hypothetical protein